jgi:hypothetical protein
MPCVAQLEPPGSVVVTPASVTSTSPRDVYPNWPSAPTLNRGWTQSSPPSAAATADVLLVEEREHQARADVQADVAAERYEPEHAGADAPERDVVAVRVVVEREDPDLRLDADVGRDVHRHVELRRDDSGGHAGAEEGSFARRQADPQADAGLRGLLSGRRQRGCERQCGGDDADDAVHGFPFRYRTVRRSVGL